MPAETPTKSPATLPAKPADHAAADKAIDRFHPEMPNIPGLTGAHASSAASSNTANAQRLVQILGAAAGVVAIAIAAFWWIKSASRKATDTVDVE